MNQSHTVVVLGASPKPARFANQAIRLLQKHEYTVVPVHPKFSEIESLAVKNSLADIDGVVDTLTLYVGAAKLDNMVDEILQLKPGRVIFNPGTESKKLIEALNSNDIETIIDCTLVMLNNDRF